ncbi:hypothetical protein R1flu_015013 [Riccia fluitans]|uniref:NADH dehydrogenase-like complex O n=1 Tax=Riccia fluitans TaxID=41844 RepID=A0ABD1YKW2_9MARC
MRGRKGGEETEEQTVSCSTPRVFGRRGGENTHGETTLIRSVMAMAVELGALRSMKVIPVRLHSNGLQRPNSRVVSIPATIRRNICYRSISAAAAEPAASPPPPSASTTPPPAAAEPAAPPPKPTFTLKKGQIVRVDKEKYLDSVEYYAVAHPKYFKGLDYIYEDRGEVLDVRMFEAGEYALVSWAGISTSPAWLPAYMLIKSDKLSYRRT